MSVNGVNSEYFELAVKAAEEARKANAEELTKAAKEEAAKGGKNVAGPAGSTIFAKKAVTTTSSVISGPSILASKSAQQLSGDTIERTSQPTQVENACPKIMSDGAKSLVKQCEELNKNNKSIAESMKESCQKGVEFNKAAKTAHELDMTQVTRTAEVLEEEFAKNPDLRQEFQGHFSELDSDTQKALILDFERRAKNGEDVSSEVKHFITGLKDADLLVKSFAHVRLRQHCTPEQLKSFDNKIGFDVTYQQAKDKYESGMVAYNLSNSSNVQDGKTALERNTKEKTEYQAGNVQILANSSAAKKSQDFRNEYNEQMTKLGADAQPEAVRAALNSEYFNEDDRNNTIGQIKKFETPEAQKKSAQYADKCERLSTRNRQFLAAQIQFLHQSVQACVIRSMAQNQLNTQNKKVMDTITKEIFNLKIDDKSKNELVSALEKSGNVPEEIISKVKESLSKQIASNDSVKVNSGVDDARQELQKQIYIATGNSELAEVIASNSFDSKPASLTQFVDLLDKGTLTPELVISAGYKKSLKTNFSALTKNSQEQVFDMLSADEISGMREKGKLPKRFEDKVMAKLTKNMTTKAALQLSRTSCFTELVNFAQNANSAKHKNIFRHAIEDRFANRAKDEGLFGGGMMA